jgi:hypothetical protein
MYRMGDSEVDFRLYDVRDSEKSTDVHHRNADTTEDEFNVTVEASGRYDRSERGLS